MHVKTPIEDGLSVYCRFIHVVYLRHVFYGMLSTITKLF
jgi:hypothetical protein